MLIRLILTALCCAATLASATPSIADDVGGKLTTNFKQSIPNLPGKSLIDIEIDYPPGGFSVPHTHAKSAFIYAYVVSGAVVSKVNDDETHTYKAGQSWFEPPGATHTISANASKTEPAKLLAVFVVDTDDKALTTPLG